MEGERCQSHKLRYSQPAISPPSRECQTKCRLCQPTQKSKISFRTHSLRRSITMCRHHQCAAVVPLSVEGATNASITASMARRTEPLDALRSLAIMENAAMLPLDKAAYPLMAYTPSMDPVFARTRPAAGPLRILDRKVPSRPAMGNDETNSQRIRGSR